MNKEGDLIQLNKITRGKPVLQYSLWFCCREEGKYKLINAGNGRKNKQTRNKNRYYVIQCSLVIGRDDNRGSISVKMFIPSLSIGYSLKIKGLFRGERANSNHNGCLPCRNDERSTVCMTFLVKSRHMEVN